jgi:hypothetical protein
MSETTTSVAVVVFVLVCALILYRVFRLILMATAAVHRVAFQGQDSTALLRIGSAFALANPLDEVIVYHREIFP